MLDQTTYDPYGNTTDTQPGEASVFEFTGRENDGNSFYYLRARYYCPAIGRFISRDPAGLSGGLNMYAYAGDSPTNFTDPTGTGCGGGDCTGPNPTGGGGGADEGFVGAFEWSGVAFLSNQGGAGHAIPAFYVGQNGGGLVDVQEEDDEPEVVEQNFELERIFEGRDPIIPSKGLLIPTERGQFLIEPGSGLGSTRNERGYRFRYARTPEGEEITIRVMAPLVRGKANYPNGYVVFNNSSNQPVDPNTFQPIPTSESHFAILP